MVQLQAQLALLRQEGEERLDQMRGYIVSLEREREGLRSRLGQGFQNDAALRKAQEEEWQRIRVERQKLDEEKKALEKKVEVAITETIEYLSLKKEKVDLEMSLNIAQQSALEEKKFLLDKVKLFEKEVNSSKCKLEEARRNHHKIEVEELEEKKMMINQAIAKEEKIELLDKTVNELKQTIDHKDAIIEEYKNNVALASYDEDLAKNDIIYDEELDVKHTILTEELSVRELTDTVEGLRKELAKRKERDEGREAAERVQGAQVGRLGEELGVMHQELEEQQNVIGILEKANRDLEKEKESLDQNIKDILSKNYDDQRKESEVMESLKEELRGLKVKKLEYEKKLRRIERYLKEETSKKRKWRKECEVARAETQTVKSEADASSLRQAEERETAADFYKTQIMTVKLEADASHAEAEKAKIEAAAVKETAIAATVKTEVAEVKAREATVKAEAAYREAEAAKAETEAAETYFRDAKIEVETAKAEAKVSEQMRIAVSMDLEVFTMALSEERREGKLERIAMMKKIRMLESMMKGGVKEKVSGASRSLEPAKRSLDQNMIISDEFLINSVTRKCYVKVEKIKVGQMISAEEDAGGINQIDASSSSMPAQPDDDFDYGLLNSSQEDQ